MNTMPRFGLWVMVLGTVVGLFQIGAYVGDVGTLDVTHDLTVYAVIEPAPGWLEAGVAVTPVLGVANLGTAPETFVPVKLFAVDGVADTVYADSTIVYYIGPRGSASDTVEAGFPEWTPEGACEDWVEETGYPIPMEFVGVHYELIGIVDLETDQKPANDSSFGEIVCLLAHDVGAVDITNKEGHAWGTDYPGGTEFTFVVTVENFGYNELRDVPVDFEIVDGDIEPDSLVWHNIQSVEYLDWRGNEDGNSYIVEIEFPTWTIPEELAGDQLIWECRTELVGDDCPVNDEQIRFLNIDPDPVEENVNAPRRFSVDINSIGRDFVEYKVYFAVPHSSSVKLAIYDVSGRLVRTFVDDSFEPGYHERTWDGTDERGRKVARGIYLVRMEAGEWSAVRKLITVY